MTAIALAAQAQTPLGTAFTYQGKLDSSGAPVNGSCDMRFTLYTAGTNGSAAAGPICLDNVAVAGGLFTVPLDFGVAAFDGNARWLAIEVRADSTAGNCAGGAYTLLAPRQPLTATPYALQTRGIFVDGSGNVGIGTSAPASALHAVSAATAITGQGGQRGVQGNATGTSGSNYGVFGVSPSDLGAGVFGTATHATGTNFGVYGTSNSPAGTGVFGSAPAASGTTYGVQGSSASPLGTGVYGLATVTTASTFAPARGVLGQATATTGFAYGVEGESSSSGGIGVAAFATAATGATKGVYGRSDSVNGSGLYGTVSSTNGLTYGVFGTSVSSSGYGVYGSATAASGAAVGVYGSSASPSGYGVLGESADNAGVRGDATGASGTNYGGYFRSDSTSGRGVFGYVSTATGTNFGGYFRSDSVSGRGVVGWATVSGGTGVFGQASAGAGGYAVYALGDSAATGVKSFRIDHPADPQNKYLLHYATESPEVLNSYRGTVLLDASGAAVVELPSYFARINKSPSYLLTAVGAAMPMLHVAEEISEAALKAGERAAPDQAAPACWFRVAGGSACGKVSWRVEALRNDLRMRLHGAPVEPQKTGVERGKYQHPEYYGQPPEKGSSHDAGNDRQSRNHPAPPTPPEATPE